MSDAPDPPLYPEHTKLEAVSEYSQMCYLFVDWLEQRGIWLCEQDRDQGGSFWVTTKTMRDLLAAFFDIDMNKIEEEKRAMLESQRKLYNGPPAVSGNGPES
jgi:hypothetical protein